MIKGLLEAIEYVTKHGKRVLTDKETLSDEFLPYVDQPIEVRHCVDKIDDVMREGAWHILREMRDIHIELK